MANDSKIYVPRGWFCRSVQLFPDWVSNGHFLIHRSRILNDYDFTSLDQVKRWFAEQVDESGMPSEDVVLAEHGNEKFLEKIWNELKAGVRAFAVTEHRLSVPSQLFSRGVVLVSVSDSNLSPIFIDEMYVDGLYMPVGGLGFSAGAGHVVFNACERSAVTLLVMPLNPHDYLQAMGWPATVGVMP